MKVITEERLKELRDQFREVSKINSNPLHIEGMLDMIEIVIDECQELDQLTVTRLRPMSEHNNDTTGILAVFKGSRIFDVVWWFNGSFITAQDEIYDPEDFVGWIPLPKYEPEQV